MSATVLLNSLLDIVRDDTSHLLYSQVAVVGDLIEAYEIDHEPPDRQNIVDAGSFSTT